MGPVEEAARAEVASMGKEAEASTLGASAIDLARRQDKATLPQQAAQVAKELRETLRRLADLWPPAPAKDGLDELRSRREERGA
ncbi:hypothetical protein [Actinomadura sp. WMMA1423]|uniref:hypothetical protein n=1 Tax=Actinomadura sp. WMMA1423 TaxID=2591108 RepID=UPI001146A77A|nr:hypothetical protein [Actinomadura sp. WMMA1423]